METRSESSPQQSSHKLTISIGPAGAAARITPPASVAPEIQADPESPLAVLMGTFNRLKQAEELRQEGKLEPAQRICEELLHEYQDFWGALHTLGLIFIDKDDNGQALKYLVRAAMLDPQSWPTLTALGGAYFALGADEMAAQTLERARAINPRDPTVLTTLGEIYEKEREYELASEVFNQALAVAADSDRAALGLARVCLHMGRDSEAVAALMGMLDRGSGSIDVFLALTRSRLGLGKVDVLAQLDKVVRQTDEDQANFESGRAFARIVALDHAGRHAEAWKVAVEANRAMFTGYGQEWWQRRRDRDNAVLTRLQMHPAPAGLGNDDARHPISLFILGPSRSGKTTMERLVGVMHGVKRGYENFGASIAVRRTFQRGGLITTDQLPLLPEGLYSLYRDIYLDQLARRAPSAKVFTNANPDHILNAPWLAAVLPNVRFVCVKRDVNDVLLRMFQFRYQEGNYYSYNLQAAREHVVWYYQMMDLLAETCPDRVRFVRYEDMVADPAAAVRTAAELCGLPAPAGPLPAIGDDRGCALPYRELMAAELAS